MSRTNRRRPFLKPMKITRRITLLYGLIFSASLLLISGFMILNVSLLQQYDARKEITGVLTAVEEFLFQGSEMDETTLSLLVQDDHIEVRVYDLDADVVYSHLGEDDVFFKEINEPWGPGEKRTYDAETIISAIKNMSIEGYHVHEQKERGNNGREYVLEDRLNRQVMLTTSWIQVEDKIYYLEVFRLIDMSNTVRRGFISKLIMADLIGILGSVLIGAYISRRVLRPVEQIRMAAERITGEDLSRRIDEDGPNDEMMELTVTFNSMIDRLEGSFQRQNQFVSDASHELRTPIAVIQGYANLINRWGKSDPDILQESIDSILTETEHMSELIKRLLLLAKSDQNKITVQKEKICLNESVQEIMKELSLLHANQEVVLKEQERVYIWANSEYMKQLLWIHVENALKYGDENGRITISVWADDAFAYISVQDTGQGISKEDLPHIFDRFYRADKSRNKEISGTGLGLSIAHWIVESHEGDVFVESVQGEGTIFTNRFKILCRDERAGEEPNKKV